MFIPIKPLVGDRVRLIRKVDKFDKGNSFVVSKCDGKKAVLTNTNSEDIIQISLNEKLPFVLEKESF